MDDIWLEVYLAMDVGSYFEQDVSFPWIVKRSDDAVDGKGQAVGTDPASTENK